MNKRKVIALLSILLIAGAAFSFIKSQQKKNQSIGRVNEITAMISKNRTELLTHYQNRYELLIKWSKQSKVPLPAELIAYQGELNTESELVSFDQLQNKISEQFNYLLKTSTSLAKNIRELQLIEEKINKTRNEYHLLSFEADDLIEKYNTGQTQIPVFPSEKMLHQLKK